MNKGQPLVFLWWTDDPYGVVITKDQSEFLTNFLSAAATSETWGEFTTRIGPEWAEYVSMFACDENGETYKPNPEEKMVELPDLFIFFDEEFPLVQCVQATYDELGPKLPATLGYEEYMTEFGMPLRMYEKARFVELKEHLDREGIVIEPMRSVFPQNIYDYASGPITVNATQ